MNNQEAVNFLNMAIQEYVNTIQQSNPCLSYALAQVANSAMIQITDVINKYNTILEAQNNGEKNETTE